MTLTDEEVQRGALIVALEVANGRMNEAYRQLQHAEHCAYRAAADAARLTLLKLADEMEGLSGMTFETEFSYDDEGGYFKTISCYPTFEDGVDGDYDHYDFIDLMNAFGAEPICVLCDVPTDAHAGQVTLEHLRQVKF